MVYKDNEIEDPNVQYALLKKFIEIRGLQDCINKALCDAPSIFNRRNCRLSKFPQKPLEDSSSEGFENLRLIDHFITWNSTHEGFEFWFNEYSLFLMNCLFLFPNNIKLKQLVENRILREFELDYDDDDDDEYDLPIHLLPLIEKCKEILKH